ncbi:hypothetical protein [Arcticibacterium luteifluviistationis]|uniref:Peptidase S74 domain-containing protein n=1 Tax=Arcticibacterium luteifluviistationis TaxID=1784714 RepID=A0A2Z4GET2_9BACT|nr:hypothetical protein [Arcticibacterium luteifluviistationis]AWV99852.1 hypothetical protein DJ013_17405 [Arcticibacterium luteifluviistationis]
MKQNYQILALLCASLSISPVFAQDNVGIGTTNPDNSALLDMQSAEKGLLIPRMTVDQRNAINNPAEGLLIFQTNEEPGFQFFNGSQWSPLSPTEAKSVATGDVNGWALDGNATASGTKAAATAASFIGTPGGIPLNFKIGGVTAGTIATTNDIFLGYNSGLNGSGSGTYNTGLGTNTLSSLTTGQSNTALGGAALRYTTTGKLNLGIGGLSLYKNTSGSNNVAIGHGTMYNNLVGNDNVALGKDVLFSSTGNNNIGIGSSSFVAKTSGNNNVGVGYLAGASNTTGSSNIFLGYAAGQNETGSSKLYISNTNTATPLIYGDFSAKFVSIGDVESGLKRETAAGNGYKLLVQGGILTEKVKVALKSSGDWADYVFEPSYNLLSLEEVEKFTLENKHLPNVPSADEMAENGLEIAETSKMFMEKIEELTLYMIDLNKEVKALKVENEILKVQMK